jgi:hypothetical protein
MRNQAEKNMVGMRWKQRPDHRLHEALTHQCQVTRDVVIGAPPGPSP